MSRLIFTNCQEMKNFDQLATPIWIFNTAEHGIWWANKKAVSFWHAETLEELVGRSFQSDSETVRDRLRQIASTGTGEEIVQDTWTLYPKGKPITAVLSFRAIHIEHGQDAVMIELMRTLIHDPDEEISRMSEATRTTSSLVSMYSLTGRLLAQNPAALSCYGTSSKIGDRFVSLGDRFRTEDLSKSVLSRVADNEMFSWECSVNTLEGPRTHQVSARKGRDPITGEFVAVLSEEDVTEISFLRKQLEATNCLLETQVAERTKALQESEERYKLAVETAAIWDFDLENGTAFISPNFTYALGYQGDELSGGLSFDIIEKMIFPADLPGCKEVRRDHLRDPDIRLSHEMRFLTRSGEPRWFHLQGKCVFSDTGRATRSVGLITDISARKKLESELLASQRLEAIGQLTGGVAHDFNNLLAEILGNAELLEVVNGTKNEFTANICQSVKRGSDLTSHLLAFARKQSLAPVTLELGANLLDMRQTILRTLNENILVRNDIPETIWPIHVDQTQFEAAILNVALNARDAMPQGGELTIACRNSPKSDPGRAEGLELDDGDYVEIALTDTGQGMSFSDVSRAFEPFYTTKTVGKGSGLGLSRVFGFSRQSGGDSVLKSHQGIGTTVFIYLPKSKNDLSNQVETTCEQTPIRGKGEHIHVVEDDPSVSRIAVKMLRSLGYVVSDSKNVHDALSVSKAPQEVDLFLVDVMLPGGKSGVDFANDLFVQDPDAKILLMSGYPNSHLTEQKLRDKPLELIAKPFDLWSISHAIQNTLNTSGGEIATFQEVEE